MAPPMLVAAVLAAAAAVPMSRLPENARELKATLIAGPAQSATNPGGSQPLAGPTRA